MERGGWSFGGEGRPWSLALVGLDVLAFGYVPVSGRLVKLAAAVGALDVVGSVHRGRGRQVR